MKPSTTMIDSRLPVIIRNIVCVTLAVMVSGITGCATIIHGGGTQKIGISSSPTGARVLVDNQPSGSTPVFADLDRGSEHIVTIDMDGYEKSQLTVTKSVSGWVWGNILLGGLIGLAVDAISGGLYNLSPEQLNAELKKAGADVSSNESGDIFIVSVLKPDPSWQKIGTLKRTTYQ